MARLRNEHHQKMQSQFGDWLKDIRPLDWLVLSAGGITPEVARACYQYPQSERIDRMVHKLQKAAIQAGRELWDLKHKLDLEAIDAMKSNDFQRWRIMCRLWGEGHGPRAKKHWNEGLCLHEADERTVRASGSWRKQIMAPRFSLISPMVFEKKTMSQLLASRQSCDTIVYCQASSVELGREGNFASRARSHEYFRPGPAWPSRAMIQLAVRNKKPWHSKKINYRLQDVLRTVHGKTNQCLGDNADFFCPQCDAALCYTCSVKHYDDAGTCQTYISEEAREDRFDNENECPHCPKCPGRLPPFKDENREPIKITCQGEGCTAAVMSDAANARDWVRCRQCSLILCTDCRPDYTNEADDSQDEQSEMDIDEEEETALHGGSDSESSDTDSELSDEPGDRDCDICREDTSVVIALFFKWEKVKKWKSKKCKKHSEPDENVKM
jgi:hypothetical protein